MILDFQIHLVNTAKIQPTPFQSKIYLHILLDFFLFIFAEHNILPVFINFDFYFGLLDKKCLKPCENGVQKFKFFFLNLSSKFPSGVKVRKSKCHYMTSVYYSYFKFCITCIKREWTAFLITTSLFIFKCWHIEIPYLDLLKVVKSGVTKYIQTISVVSKMNALLQTWALLISLFTLS